MVKSYSTKSLLTLLLTLTFLIALSKTSYAIPAFARKYQTSCMTCHATFPKLNTFGETFRRNGYQIPDVDERYVKEKPVKLGAPAWKEVWPDGVWPGTLPGLPPISLLARSLYRYDDGSQVRHDFTFPDEIELLTAGTIGEDISFLGTIALVEKDGNFGGVERLFVQFDNLFSGRLSSHLINLKIGQFEPAFLPVSLHRRLTHTRQLITTARVGSNEFTLSEQRGAEINGIFKSRMEYAIGIVNGNGTGRGDGSGALDNNSQKDIYLKVGYKFGGIGLDGLGIEGGGWLPGDWKERSLSIGAFGYSGENRTSSTTTVNDSFYRYGLNMDLYYGNLNLFGAFVAGSHDNPDGNGVEREIATCLVEGNLLLYPWLTGVVRYESVDVDRDAVEDAVTIGLVALIRANLKLTVEGDIHTRGEESDRAFLILEFAI
ncbi:MAG: hypothetical protein ACE5D4_05200 [Thermodesulfobacteriota bacterium]